MTVGAPFSTATGPANGAHSALRTAFTSSSGPATEKSKRPSRTAPKPSASRLMSPTHEPMSIESDRATRPLRFTRRAPTTVERNYRRAIAERSDVDGEFNVKEFRTDSPSTATAPCAVVTSSSRIPWTSGRPYRRRTAWHAMVVGLSEWSDIGLLSMLGERGNEHVWHEYTVGTVKVSWAVQAVELEAAEVEAEAVRERDALPGSFGRVGESGKPADPLNLDSRSEEVEQE